MMSARNSTIIRGASHVLRPLDAIGRVVIPKSARQMLSIERGDKIEILVADDAIVLRKYIPFCVFCGSRDSITYHHEKPVCSACRSDLKGYGVQAF